MSDQPFTLPPWLFTLFNSAINRQYSIEWLIDTQTQEFTGGQATDVFNFANSHLPLVDEHKSFLDQECAHYRIVGIASLVHARGSMALLITTQPTYKWLLSGYLCLDLRRLDQLWLALSSSTPVTLWVPVGQTPESLALALDTYALGKRIPSEEELPNSCRFYMASKEDFDGEIRDFENRVVVNEFCDNLMWGSAHERDPYNPAESFEFESLPVLTRAAVFRETLRQASTRLPSTSFRSVYSRSIITITEHYDFWLVRVLYRPTPDSQRPSMEEVIEKANERYHLGYPADIPVDVIMALLGLPLIRGRRIGPGPTQEAWPALRPFARVYLLYIMGLLDEPALHPQFPFLTRDPNILVRWMAMLVARWHGLTGHLQSMYEAEQNPDLRECLHIALQDLSTKSVSENTARPAPMAGQPRSRVGMALKPIYRFHMMAVAWIEHWDWLTTQLPPDEERRVFIWGLPERDTQILYGSENREDDLGFLIIDGETPEMVAVRLRRLLPIYTFEEIAQQFHQATTPHELAAALHVLRNDMTRAASQPHMELVREALAHPDPEIRRYAILMMQPALWPEFLDLLRPIEANDGDEDVRQAATHLREAIEAKRNNSSTE
jgi:hypothetical protein